MVITVPPQLRCIEAIEDSYVAAIRGSPIGTLLREVATLPGDMTPEEVGERMKALPAAFVAFGGGSGAQGRSPTIEGNFTVFAVTGQGPGEAQRRRGTAVSVGAYQIVQAIYSALHGNQLPTPQIGSPAAPIDGLVIGAPYGVDIRRYWSADVDELGLAIYGVTFNQRITFPPIDPDDIADFVTFKGQTTDPEADDGGEALPLPAGKFLEETDVTLPTE